MAPINLKQYYVKKLNIINNSFSLPIEEKPSITFSPDISVMFERVKTTNIVNVHLNCRIMYGQEAAPFSLEVEVVGVFQIFDEKNIDTLLQKNAIAILYPYMRTSVSQLMSLAEIAPIRLPVIKPDDLEFEKLESTNN